MTFAHNFGHYKNYTLKYSDISISKYIQILTWQAEVSNESIIRSKTRKQKE